MHFFPCAIGPKAGTTPSSCTRLGPGKMDRSTVTGILLCITGNVLISLGLNYQKTSRYMKSYKWWLGFTLMTSGEIENFIAYGFLKIVLVSSLGIITLISNIVIAPLFFAQHLRVRDITGTAIASVGVVLIIVSLSSETKITDPVRYFDDTIFTSNFVAYLVATISVVTALIIKKNKEILHNLFIVAIFGSYTVISTKLLSVLIEDSVTHIYESYKPLALFIVIVVTSYLQISYLNRALKLSSSTVVIPLHYIFFNLAIILSSLIVFKEFRQTSLPQLLGFALGISFAFVGVAAISAQNTAPLDEEDAAIDADISEEQHFAPEASTGLIQRARSTSNLLLAPVRSWKRRHSTEALGSSYGSVVVGSGLIVNTFLTYTNATTGVADVDIETSDHTQNTT